MIRLTTWTDANKVEHVGVPDLGQLSEKMAIIAQKKFNEGIKKEASKNGEQK